MDTYNKTPIQLHPRHDVTMDFTTISGKHLRIRVPLNVFDQLSVLIGNGYKTGCWIVARCNEVEKLSLETIERYVNIMAQMKLDEACQHSIAPGIGVQAA